jgi:hypothetical protein
MTENNITLTNGEVERLITSQATVAAIKKEVDPKASYWIARGIDKASKIFEVCQTERRELFKIHAELNEKGVVKQDEQGGIVWKSQKDQDDALEFLRILLAEPNDFGFRLIKVDWKKLEDKGVTFMPENWIPLLPLIEPPPEE